MDKKCFPVIIITSLACVIAIVAIAIYLCIRSCHQKEAFEKLSGKTKIMAEVENNLQDVPKQLDELYKLQNDQQMLRNISKKINNTSIDNSRRYDDISKCN